MISMNILSNFFILYLIHIAYQLKLLNILHAAFYASLSEAMGGFSSSAWPCFA